MKRNTYVDEKGNAINYSFESKKPLLNIFFVIGTVIPLILVGLIIYTAVNNNYCHGVYNNVKEASYEYLKDNAKLPEYEGDFVKINMKDLYEHSYLKTNETNNKKAGGTVKVTKYKEEYIYTLDINNCDKCSVNNRYKNWQNEVSYYDKGKAIVDVIPYYNIYDRQVAVTAWSKLYDADEINDKASEYGVKMPIEDKDLPKVPSESQIAEVQTEKITYYRYRDKLWRWYDIVGDYSDFSSIKPAGYSNRDDNTMKYTDYTEYSLEYPEEQSYREIVKKTGYKYYYLDDKGNKVYANNGKYTVDSAVDRDVYTEHEDEEVTMYSYRDKQWKWYNGQKRRYSNYRTSQPEGYNYRDDELFQLGSYSSWETTSKLTAQSMDYRVEETKVMTRYRYLYEILSLKLLPEDLPKEKFEQQLNSSLEELRTLETYKVEVSYKFKYRNAK